MTERPTGAKHVSARLDAAQSRLDLEIGKEGRSHSRRGAVHYGQEPRFLGMRSQPLPDDGLLVSGGFTGQVSADQVPVRMAVVHSFHLIYGHSSRSVP